jgi:signal transduction histidine kinase
MTRGGGGLRTTAPATFFPGRSSVNVRNSSLRSDLLLTFAVLGSAALFLAVMCMLFFLDAIDSPYASIYLTVMIAADVLVFLVFGSHQVRRLVLRPLGDALQATEAIAKGDLARRVPMSSTQEFALLADSVNRMTDRLIEGHAQLARAERLVGVGRLAAGIAHEIGNPLGAITGYAHLLKKKASSDSQVHEVVAGLERETQRIDRIIRGLLDYARPRRRTPAPIDVNEVIKGAVHLLIDQGVLRQIDVALELDTSSPQLLGEHHELDQLFVNLMLNAADAMDGEGSLFLYTQRVQREGVEGAQLRRAEDPPGEHVGRRPHPRVQAWLGAAPRPDELMKVIVADSGPGVAPEDADRIFDPFYTTKEPGKGTGLGLAIVARTVENLAGTIWVDPARGGGAAFHMLFPLAPVIAEVRRTARAEAGTRQ